MISATHFDPVWEVHLPTSPPQSNNMGKAKDVGSYTGMDNGLQGNKVRGHLHVIILHIGIRIRYMIESWFYLKPLLSSSLTAYPSILRPKGIPKVDWPTLFAIRMLWLFGAIVRTHRIFLPFLLKTGIMQALQWFHARLMVSFSLLQDLALPFSSLYSPKRTGSLA